MGMCSVRNTWLSCTTLLHMFNIMPLEQGREELGKEANSTHVTGLDVHKTSKTEKTVAHSDLELERWKGNKSESKESSRKKQTACT